MAYDPEKHHRRSIRLKGYDYASPGAYFVTICVQDRECVLGEVVNGYMQVTKYGQMAHDFWDEVPVHFPNVSVDAFVVMPNHVHAIIVINDVSQGGEGGVSDCGGAVTAPCAGDTTTIDRPTLGQIVAYYKHQTTKHINQMRDTPGTRFWQRNYWEHIIRNEASYRRIYEYVEHNPALWEEDQLHPDAPPNPFNRG